MSARLAPALLLAALVEAPWLAFSACGSDPVIKLCGEIPAGGCPIGRGGTCADAECAGLYDCVEGKWTEVVPCSQALGEGGVDGDGDGGVGEAGADGACSPVKIDHQGETLGCKQLLEYPDCPAVAAEECAETVCVKTGCSDFFLCKSDGEGDVWIEVAYCDDQQNLVVVTK